MRIFLISGEFPPMQGGVGDYTREMARAFIAQGHEVWVLVPDVLQDAYAVDSEVPWRVLPIVQDWEWGCWRQIRSQLAEIQPDVVDIQYQAAVYDMRVPAINFLPWRLSRLFASLPVVVTFHDLKPPYLFPKAGPLRGWVVRMLARCSSAAIVTNREDLHVAKRWPFFRPRRAHSLGGRFLSRPMLCRIPIGSNIAVTPPQGFERDAWRARLGYGPEDCVWAYFGFLNESKGGETLIQALAQSEPGTFLLMIGGRVGSSDATNQAYAARVQALIDRLGVADRVQWTGYVSSEEVSAALLCADVLVLPYRDGISFRRGSLHAALVHGCAIVSTVPRVSLDELRDGENILLVSPDDPQALSHAAARLWHDPALRNRVGQGAKALAQHFTWEHIARRTVDEVFMPLLQGPSTR